MREGRGRKRGSKGEKEGRRGRGGEGKEGKRKGKRGKGITPSTKDSGKFKGNE